MKRRPAILTLLIPALLAAPAAAGTRSARDSFKKGDYPQAIVQYSKIRLTRSPEKAAEYAHALALGGFKDLALGHLDQALALQQNNPAASGIVNFHAARVFQALGQEDVAQELASQAVPPDWLAGAAMPKAVPAPAPEAKGDLENDLVLANSLMLQRRFYTAVDRFQRLAAGHPNEPRVYAGYAIALEKIGAYRKAARAVARSMELEGPALTGEKRDDFESHKQELEARPQAPPPSVSLAKRANRTLKGRYLAFVGGNINRTARNTVSNLNTRVGKFFTNRFDAGVTAGYTAGNIPKKYRGASFGLAGRYHQPLPVPAPLNATFGSRVEYQPRPDKKTAVIVSPGLSWVQETGSLDLFYEYGISGRLKKTSSISLGYTVYFGRSR